MEKVSSNFFEITKCLKSLFDNAKIDYLTGENLVKQITTQVEKDFMFVF